MIRFLKLFPSLLRRAAVLFSEKDSPPEFLIPEKDFFANGLSNPLFDLEPNFGVGRKYWPKLCFENNRPKLPARFLKIRGYSSINPKIFLPNHPGAIEARSP